jgi:putative DNA primase/helicase
METTFNQHAIHDNQLFYGQEEKWTWLSNAIWVRAKTSGEGGAGRLLEFVDDDGKLHEIFIQMSEISGKCEQFFGRLMDAGFICSNRKIDRDSIVRYILQTKVQQRVTRTLKTGWVGDVFAFPDKVCGVADTRVVCTAPHIREVKGTLADWQSNVARYCVGNSRLVLGVCAAFASSVLKIFNHENVGFHIIGASSSGKTTCLNVASSVFGTPLNSWRATDNGLEGLAVQHNDALLILDELAQINPAQAGDAVYMLANGASKSRADKYGNPLKTNAWRLMFLSSGETNLDLHMKSAKQRVRAGQELRFINVPAEPLMQDGEPHGVFENIHAFPNGSAFAQNLSAKAAQFNGLAIEAFLEKITQDLADMRGYCAEVAKHLHAAYEKQQLSGQNQRILEHFIFLSVVGEYARFVTGWESGEATKGCLKCFDDWLEAEGSEGAREEQQIIEQVQLFFEQHAESRLQDLNDTTRPVSNMVGYKDESFYYVTPQAFKAVLCRGWPYRTVAETLVKRGCLEKQEGKHSILKKVGGRVIRVYKIDQNLLNECSS